MITEANPTKEEIIALETSYWEAMKAKNGACASQLSGRISLVTGAQGVMSVAKSEMGKMTEEGKWTLESYAFDDIAVTTPAPDVAVIAYTVNQKVTMDGKSQSLRAADRSTWIRGADGWECHAHSETLLKNDSAAN